MQKIVAILKFLAILSLKNYSFNPDRPAYLSTDSSRLCAGFMLSQPDDDDVLQPITMGSTMLSVPETRQEAPAREANALAWAVSQIEPYLLNTNSTIVAMTDSQPLSYLTNCKKWHSRYFELSVALSQYRSIEIVYTPGRFLVGADLLSRNIQNALVKQDDTLSESFAKIGIPLPYDMRNKVLKMSNEEFRTYLMSNCKAPLVDIQRPAYNYVQSYVKYHLSTIIYNHELLYS